MKNTAIGQPIIFRLNDGKFAPEWQVTMNEDGSLFILPTGRKNGRILVQPSSHTTINITTDAILKTSVLSVPSVA